MHFWPSKIHNYAILTLYLKNSNLDTLTLSPYPKARHLKFNQINGDVDSFSI